MGKEFISPQKSFRETVFTSEEETFLDTEIDNLIRKGVIAPSEHEEDEFISPIFLRKKGDNSFRLILNLKSLNKI